MEVAGNARPVRQGPARCPRGRREAPLRRIGRSHHRGDRKPGASRPDWRFRAAQKCPLGDRHGQSRGLDSGRTVGLADVWESELLIWTESRYRELYLGDQPFPPGWTRL